MTPEQKAFYEYGKAREALRLFKTDFAYREETLREFYENYVRNAWQKRAACRAWKLLAQRHCLNCLYRENPVNAAPCADCTLGDLTEDFWLVCKWKPRKEASND